MMDFVPWAKTPRLFRDMTVTEKIDGTNAAVIVEKFGNELNHPDHFERYSDRGEPGRTTIVLAGGSEKYKARLIAHDTDLYLVGAQTTPRDTSSAAPPPATP